MKRRTVVVAPAASEDVEHVVSALIVHAGRGVADRVEQEIFRGLESLERLADRGRHVPELRSRGYVDYRELVCGVYRIIYRVESGRVWVLAVFDHRRDLEELLHVRARHDRSK